MRDLSCYGFKQAIVLNRRFISTVTLIIVSFLIAHQGLYAQANTSSESFFPLDIGDYWEYFDYEEFEQRIVDTLGVTVIQDSVVAGKSYKVSKKHSFRYNLQWVFLERTDSLGNVFRYNSSTGSDELWYRLSDTSSSSWRRQTFIARFNSSYTAPIFEQQRRLLDLLFYDELDTSLIAPLFIETLAEGIGLVYSAVLLRIGEGVSYPIRGAKINGVIMGTITSIADKPRQLPSQYVVYQNYPNPFWNAAASPARSGGNTSTTIEYQIPKTEYVHIVVYDLLGKQIAVLESGQKAAGKHTVTWDGKDQTGGRVPSGTYFYKIEIDGRTLTRKMTVVR